MSPTQTQCKSSCRCRFLKLVAPTLTLFSYMSTTQDSRAHWASRRRASDNGRYGVIVGPAQAGRPRRYSARAVLGPHIHYRSLTQGARLTNQFVSRAARRPGPVRRGSSPVEVDAARAGGAGPGGRRQVVGEATGDECDISAVECGGESFGDVGQPGDGLGDVAGGRAGRSRPRSPAATPASASVR